MAYTVTPAFFWNASEFVQIINGNTVTGYSTSDTHITEYFYNNVDTAEVALDGVDKLTGIFHSGFTVDRLGLKWDPATGVPTWTGQIKEIVVVSDNTDRQKIEGYLAHKWGLTDSLPVDHPYKTSPPTV
jgi:hypothetical protein